MTQALKLQSDYRTLLFEVKNRIRMGQYQALKAVNKELITLYWDIGKMIADRQKGNSWTKISNRWLEKLHGAII